MGTINVNLDNLTKEEREQLLSLVEKGNRPKYWKPLLGAIIFSIAPTGIVRAYRFHDDDKDKQMWQIGNMYETAEKAEFAAEQQRVRRELELYAMEHNQGDISWKDIWQEKWSIYYVGKDNELRIGRNNTDKRPGIYFTSKKIACEAIMEVGEDRIKKYLFEVE